MPVVDILLEPKPATPTADITFVADVDALSEGNLCSCAAGDDNPF
jgi:hypothetical protein